MFAVFFAWAQGIAGGRRGAFGEGAFGNDVDDAMPVKPHGPAECAGIRKRWIEGRPDPAHISTSSIERSNPTLRMSIRAYVDPGVCRSGGSRGWPTPSRRRSGTTPTMWRSTSGATISVGHALATHRQLESLDGIGPAMAAGVTARLWNIPGFGTSRLWNIGGVVRLVDEAAPKPNRPTACRSKREISNQPTTRRRAGCKGMGRMCAPDMCGVRAALVDRPRHLTPPADRGGPKVFANPGSDGP